MKMFWYSLYDMNKVGSQVSRQERSIQRSSSFDFAILELIQKYTYDFMNMFFNQPVEVSLHTPAHLNKIVYHIEDIQRNRTTPVAQKGSLISYATQNQHNQILSLQSIHSRFIYSNSFDL